MRTVVIGRLLRHHRNMSQPDGGEWRALQERRKPAGEEWAVAKARFTSGVVATGVVLSHHPFGFCVDLGGPVTGLVEIPRVKEPGQPGTHGTVPRSARRSLLSCSAPSTCSVRST
jgi:hypothetical protein